MPIKPENKARLYGDIEERVLHRGHFTDFCWEWQGCKRADGYGRVTIDGKTLYVHRAIMEWALKRTLRREEIVDHTCRNRLCFRPSHLEIVTHSENVRRGLVAKLTEKDVDMIFYMASQKTSQKDIAKKFGVHGCNISRILNGKRWEDHHHTACDRTIDMFEE